MISRTLLQSACVLALLASAGCGKAPGSGDANDAPLDTTFGERIVAAAKEPGNWLTTGLNYQETRFSPLDSINQSNIGKLKLAWSYDLDTNRGQESTPIVVDGVIYTSSAWSKVQAFDGVTGKLLWQFDPKVPGDAAVNACCDVVNRGVAYWDGKVFVGTIDGRLIAINAKTGQQVWSTMTIDPNKPYSITGAPRIVKGLVMIGNGGAEFGVRGYVSAYRADTGTMAWRFYTVPGDPDHPDNAASDAILDKLAKKTWDKDHWKISNGNGGGTVWDSMAYDPDLDLLYVGVGNGSYWPQKYRSPNPYPGGNNDNLFVASILALRPETGEYVWHYQATPGDQWDYTSTQHMILADLKIDGKVRKVLMQAPKNGFFYVLDRQNGKLISAEPYSKVTWADGVDLKTGRPRTRPEANYSLTGKPWSSVPGPQGAHGWPPMSFNPQTGLVYLPTQEIGFTYELAKNFKPLPRGYNIGSDVSVNKLPVEPVKLEKARETVKGFLTAWDPVKGKAAWRVPMPNGANGGVLSTAGGLVLQGGSTGYFNAYDVKDGRKLWSFDAQSGIVAAPISWAKDGTQYVTIMVGWGTTEGLGVGPINWGKTGPRRNISRVLTFALDGKAALPAMKAGADNTLSPPPQFADAATIEEGRQIYHRSCYGCHGYGAMSGGVLPDLRYSGTLGNQEAWDSVVLQGLLKDQGMVSFAPNYTPAEVNAIRAYVIDQAHKSVEFGSK
ncbi:PQQ-dependent dehydrogenase, methanol/ethanol family [Novosphingobium resinovorum]|uniref:PQQ-dependent dehydrogenase, methanol/ethanol family n=1 Tax=Novosphingobium resinovorum TaxID=158500 RepID=UPI002ED32925|nr:PQQ-dependent dehydrogenase, methanol/ethanol family [Novosphingobium resinovorum]